ncbi:MAG: NifU family protein [Bdellovibrionaceae bacterium]|nr:NifU family protein [Pseudobdellovibrionaceae bacterium]
MMLSYEILVRTLPTPNPTALKFVVNAPLKTVGKATFSTPQEAQGVPLVEMIFSLGNIIQVHIFENVMTVTFTEDAPMDKRTEEITAVLQTRVPVHNADFKTPEEMVAKKKRENLSPDEMKIEEILDRTIRPGLQADGGDLEVIEYRDNVLVINYQGACGTCPSSMYGTLDAIQSILQEEFNPELRVEIGM